MGTHGRPALARTSHRPRRHARAASGMRRDAVSPAHEAAGEGRDVPQAAVTPGAPRPQGVNPARHHHGLPGTGSASAPWSAIRGRSTTKILFLPQKSMVTKNKLFRRWTTPGGWRKPRLRPPARAWSWVPAWHPAVGGPSGTVQAGHTRRGHAPGLVTCGKGVTGFGDARGGGWPSAPTARPRKGGLPCASEPRGAAAALLENLPDRRPAPQAPGPRTWPARPPSAPWGSDAPGTQALRPPANTRLSG